LSAMDSPTPVLCIVAPGSGYGKTKLIEGVVSRLLQSGVKCCVLKHSAHEFDPAGKDTSRFRAAGAIGSAIMTDAGPASFFVQKSSLESCLSFLEGLGPDIILCEGFKNSKLPKIVILRETVEFGLLRSLENVAAVLYDGEAPESIECPLLDSEDAVVAFILSNFLARRVEK